jgi:two-component system nitrate/nitrite response regulator NarL
VLISVLTASSSPVARAGLASLFADLPGCALAGSTTSARLSESAEELQPDAILWQLAPDEEPRLPAHYPTVLLTANAATGLLKAGARGVLSLEATPEQIRIALEAAVAGLAVFTPRQLYPPAENQTAHLTGREVEVLRMIANGLANKEIAWKLGISEHTVKFHVSALLGKLGASSRAEAVGSGIRHGVIML